MSQDSLLPCINPMQCIDGKKRMCHIRGKMRKKVWVGQGDIVLVGLRDYQDEKADVILKYSADEARVLKQYGELPAHLRINDTDVVLEGEDNENAGAVLKLCFFTLCLLHVLCPIQHIQQCAYPIFSPSCMVSPITEFFDFDGEINFTMLWHQVAFACMITLPNSRFLSADLAEI